jgi:uncharacterized membrane protein YfcA
MNELVVGGIGIMIAALLGGATGFGFGLVAAPSLLAAGLPLREVVAVNLTLALLTRLLSAWQLRRHLVWARAGRLIAGSVPGILAGFAVRGAIDTDTLKILAGVVAIGAALVLTFRSDATRTGTTRPSAALVAGAGGGFLGVTTSLNGVPPALLLTRDRVEQLSFVADLTVYFVTSNILTLTLLMASDPDTLHALGRYVLVWLPVGLLGNLVGVRSARFLPYRVFRGISLTVVFVSGCVTIAGAL